MKFIYSVVLSVSLLSFGTLAYLIPIQEQMLKDQLTRENPGCIKEKTKDE